MKVIFQKKKNNKMKIIFTWDHCGKGISNIVNCILGLQGVFLHLKGLEVIVGGMSYGSCRRTSLILKHCSRLWYQDHKSKE